MKSKIMYRRGGVLIAFLLSFSLIFFGCSNNSGSSGDGDQNQQNKNPSTSLEEQEKPEGSLETAEVESQETTNGILLKVQVPSNGIDHYTVFIDGIGEVGWYSLSENPSEVDFFYPYVNDGKTYKLRFVFENPLRNAAGFEYSSEVVAWKDVEVKANGGLGEVIINPKAEAVVTASGILKIKTRPVFSDASKITDWNVEVQGYEGELWTNKNSKGWKWKFAETFKKDELDKEVPLVQKYVVAPSFVSCLVRYSYKDSDDKTWSYQTSGLVSEVKLNESAVEDVTKKLVITDKCAADTNGLLVEFPAPTLNVENWQTVNFFFVASILTEDGKELPVDCRGYYNNHFCPEKIEFYYPFVASGSTYTVKVYWKTEKLNSSGYSIGETTLVWGEKTVTAQSGQGELAIAIPEVSISKAGVITFSKKPTISAASKLSEWGIEIQGYYGESWEKENSTGWKYITANEIESDDLNEEFAINDLFDILPAFINIKVYYNYENNGDTYYYKTTGSAMDVKVDESAIADARKKLVIADKTASGTNGILVEFEAPEFEGDCNFRVKIGASTASKDEDFSLVYWKSGFNPKDTLQFYYPYVDNGKSYKLRVCFQKDRLDSNGFTTENVDLLWNEVTVTANGGLGEIEMKSLPEISVDNDGNVKVTKTPVFTKENLISDWYLQVAVYAGSPWETENAAWKWQSNFNIPKSDIDKTHNLYLQKPSWASISLPVGFVAAQPKVQYKDTNNEEWEYQFEPSYVVKTSLPSENVMLESATLRKIAGTLEKQQR